MKKSKRKAKERGLLRYHPDEVPDGATNSSTPKGTRWKANRRFHWNDDRIRQKRTWLRRNRKKGQSSYAPRPLGWYPETKEV